MNRKLQFQFTLRQLLIAMIWFSLAFAIVGWLVSASQDSYWIQSYTYWTVFGLSPLILGALGGAGIGTLRRATWRGAVHGLRWSIYLFLFLPIAVAMVASVLQRIGFHVFPN